MAWGALLAGCHSPRTDEPTGGVASGGPSSAATATAAPTPGPYDVHEWGLVREDQNGTLRVGAAAAHREQEIIVITKPVLYFHADVALTLKSVRVAVPGGEVAETWPIAKRDAGGHGVSWLDVSIDPKSACRSSLLPRKIDPPCSTLPPDDCESAGLTPVRTVDASCVRFGESVETFLFYRGSTTSETPPLRFKSEANGDVRVENQGALPIPGFLIRIEREGRKTRTLSVRPPAPHASSVVGRNFPSDKSVSQFASPDEPQRFRGQPPPQEMTGPAREDIRASMLAVGQLDTEADAFLKTWDDALFGVVVRNGGVVAEPQTTFFYFLPEASVARYAEVSFDPPPRTFRRALAVWTGFDGPTGPPR